jgi:beta-glucosidase
VNPSGKLTQTYPLRLEDNPAFINYPGDNGRVYYGEGIYVGYRYYEKKAVTPLFPFGFGLSYSSFEYKNLRLSTNKLEPDQSLSMSLDITNTSTRAGQEIVQVYVRDVTASVHRPNKELKDFSKVTLEPGETKTVTITLEKEAFAFWDDLQHAWVAEAGEFEVLIGSSSQDIRARASTELAQTTVFGGKS